MQALLSGVGFIVTLYSILVMQTLWNWFVAPTLHTSPVSYLTMLALNLFISMLIWQKFEEKQGWAQVWEWERENEHESDWLKAGTNVAQRFAGNTFALGIGWTIHTFFV